jgi:hypothetical protein
MGVVPSVRDGARPSWAGQRGQAGTGAEAPGWRKGRRTGLDLGQEPEVREDPRMMGSSMVAIRRMRPLQRGQTSPSIGGAPHRAAHTARPGRVPWPPRVARREATACASTNGGSSPRRTRRGAPARMGARTPW